MPNLGAQLLPTRKMNHQFWENVDTILKTVPFLSENSFFIK